MFGRVGLAGLPVPQLVSEGEGLGLAAGVDEDHGGLGVDVAGLDLVYESGH